MRPKFRNRIQLLVSLSTVQKMQALCNVYKDMIGSHVDGITSWSGNDEETPKYEIRRLPSHQRYQPSLLVESLTTKQFSVATTIPFSPHVLEKATVVELSARFAGITLQQYMTISIKSVVFVCSPALEIVTLVIRKMSSEKLLKVCSTENVDMYISRSSAGTRHRQSGKNPPSQQDVKKWLHFRERQQERRPSCQPLQQIKPSGRQHVSHGVPWQPLTTSEGNLLVDIELRNLLSL